MPAVACPLFPMKRWYEGLGATMTSDDDGVHANDLASDLLVCLCSICCWLDVDVARLLIKCVECWPIATLFEPATRTEVAEKSLPEAHAAYAAYASIPEGRTVGIIIITSVVVRLRLRLRLREGEKERERRLQKTGLSSKGVPRRR